MDGDKKSNGALIGLVIIILLLILGGLYIWNNNESSLPADIQQEVAEDQDAAALDALDSELQSETDLEVDVTNVE